MMAAPDLDPAMDRRQIVDRSTTLSVYKGVEVSDQLADLLVHMREAGACCEELASLGQHWDLLSILGQMSGGATDMGRTREGFRQLASELLTQLGTETLKKSVQQLTSKAQVAVDIVIRNLFERTADIGFLATDDDIRRFLREGGDATALVARFKEYVAKYSVYHDIILLSPDGAVLARIDDSVVVEHSADALVRDALTTSGAYVEAFRHIDLLPQHKASLVYAYRVTESNDARSRPLGVLCLCFRFENELEGVFRNLTQDGDWSILTLLDDRGTVIATSDAHQVPLGVTMPLVLDEPHRVIRFAGRQYLAKTSATQGYQGYRGPGWYGHALAPLEHAFERNPAKPAARIETSVLDAVTRNQQLFAPALQRIPADAEIVQQQLDRAVWNGNIRRDGRGDGGAESAVKVLLWEISKTGGRTRTVFERSIRDLHQTVTSSLLNDAEFLASLAIDIMDRNLYERANDCRWWALTTTFRERLEQAQSGSDEEIAAILAYINGLYTVYSNLFVYDREGTIVAVSNPSQSDLVGTARREPWIAATLAQTSSQQYTVSPFQSTDLYGGQATYVYGAAIRGRSATSRAVGGIGIVFDGQPQFEAMLRDSLPRTAGGEIVDGAFGAFVDAERRVLSTTSPDLRCREVLDVDADLCALPPGQGVSRVIEWRGHYYAVGARASAGYREYKSDTDGYRNAVTSLVLIPLGTAGTAVARRSSTGAVAIRADRRTGDVVELATFHVGGQWLGVRAGTIVEALGVDSVTALPVANPHVVGLTHFRGKPIPILTLGTSARAERARGGQLQVVVVQTPHGPMGVVVDALAEIPEVSAERIQPIPAVVGEGSYVEGIVRPDAGEQWPGLLVLVDAARLCATLMGGAGDLLAELGRLEQAMGHHEAADRTPLVSVTAD
jgi:chemotaxis signal transduction protein